jgi:hypothetical protein
MYSETPSLGMLFGRTPDDYAINDIYKYRVKVFDHTAKGIVERWFLSDKPVVTPSGKLCHREDAVLVPLLIRRSSDYSNRNRVALYPMGISEISNVPDTVAYADDFTDPHGCNVTGILSAVHWTLRELAHVFREEFNLDWQVWNKQDVPIVRPVIRYRLGIPSPATSHDVFEILNTSDYILECCDVHDIGVVFDQATDLFNGDRYNINNTTLDIRHDAISSMCAQCQTVPMSMFDKHIGGVCDAELVQIEDCDLNGDYINDVIETATEDLCMYDDTYSLLINTMLQCPVSFDFTVDSLDNIDDGGRVRKSNLSGDVHTTFGNMDVHQFDKRLSIAIGAFRPCSFVAIMEECITQLAWLFNSVNTYSDNHDIPKTMRVRKTDDELVVFNLKTLGGKEVAWAIDLFHAICTNSSIVTLHKTRVDGWKYLQHVK